MTTYEEDPRVRSLLVDVDAPMDPPPALEARLRAELGLSPRSGAPRADPEPEVVVEHLRTTGRRRPGRMPELLVAAALVVAVAVGGAIALATSTSDGRVDTVGDQSSLDRHTERDVRAACDHFDATGFGELSRQEVIGPSNATSLTTPDEVARAATTLQHALIVARDDLDLAGINDPVITDGFRRAISFIDHSFVMLQSGRLSSALGDLRKVRDFTGTINEALTRLGVPSCL